MGATCSLKVEVQLVAGTWTDITADTIANEGLRIKYGIDGSGPLDNVASTGECSFTLNNSASNSVATQGAYSPMHASVRAGWTYGIPVRVSFIHGSDASQSITSITRSGSTATATKVGHGYSTDEWVRIAGADQAAYDILAQITAPDADTFTYTVSGTPATPATGTITAQREYPKFRGKIRVIAPEPGQYRTQRVRVTAYDIIRDLAEADAREVDIQINQNEDDLITEALDSVPATAQPVARDLDAGVDTYTYAFHEVGSGVKALSLIKDVCDNGAGLAFVKGDGTFCFRSRNTRATGTSAYTFNNTMHELQVPSDLEGVYNLVRVTIHPKTVDAAATTVLYSLTGTAPSIAAGASLTLWGEYRDPNDQQTLVGGTAMVTPLVATTDYTGNAAADGSGADMTSDLSIVTSAFASTGKFVITNTHATTAAYVTKLQIRGKGIYDLGPQTYQSYTAKDYGVQPLNIDLRYQDSAAVAQSMAEYFDAQYNALAGRQLLNGFIANDSADFLRQALAREPNDIITDTETMTGLSGAEAVIQSVELNVSEGNWIYCRFGLAPAAPFRAWVLGITGRTELGTTTILGF